jgi:hypothetical protein
MSGLQRYCRKYEDDEVKPHCYVIKSSVKLIFDISLQLTEEERRIQHRRVSLYNHTGVACWVPLRNDDEHSAIEKYPMRRA